MAEFTNVPLQTVAAGQNVLFDADPVRASGSILHREGSGIVRLKGGSGCQCRALYKITFGANIQVPTGGTVEPISIAISLDGEPLGSATAIYTPAAVETFGNVFVAVFAPVVSGCCMTVAVENTSTQPIEVQNANLIVERVA